MLKYYIYNQTKNKYVTGLFNQELVNTIEQASNFNSYSLFRHLAYHVAKFNYPLDIIRWKKFEFLSVTMNINPAEMLKQVQEQSTQSTQKVQRTLGSVDSMSLKDLDRK